MLRSVGNLMLHFAETIDGLHDGLCEAVRFISADTIEEKIIKLQDLLEESGELHEKRPDKSCSLRFSWDQDWWIETD